MFEALRFLMTKRTCYDDRTEKYMDDYCFLHNNRNTIVGIAASGRSLAWPYTVPAALFDRLVRKGLVRELGQGSRIWGISTTGIELYRYISACRAWVRPKSTLSRHRRIVERRQYRDTFQASYKARQEAAKFKPQILHKRSKVWHSGYRRPAEKQKEREQLREAEE